MKDLECLELRRYRVPAPIETEVGFKAFFPNSKVYSFEFPIEQATLKTIITTCKYMGIESTRISASIFSEMMSCIAMPKNVYLIQEQLQNSDECIVWQYNPRLEMLRAQMYRVNTGRNFDINGTVLQLNQYDGEIPALKDAYESRMQKNRGFYYGKGRIGRWKFVHLKADSDFPWKTLQEISQREFGDNLTQMFFNEETKKHPGEFVLWYHPDARQTI